MYPHDKQHSITVMRRLFWYTVVLAALLLVTSCAVTAALSLLPLPSVTVAVLPLAAGCGGAGSVVIFVASLTVYNAISS